MSWPLVRWLALAVVSAAVIVLMILAIIGDVHHGEAFVASGTHTTATVTGLSDNGQRDPNAYLVVAFRSSSGRSITTHCPVTQVDDYQLGNRVAITYDPNQPTTAVLTANPDPAAARTFDYGIIVFALLGLLTGILRSVYAWYDIGTHGGRHSR